MAGFIRHVQALTRKNVINWRRTWFGSLLEIVFPILCMIMVSQLYLRADPVNRGQQEYLNLAYAQYPVTNPIGIRWTYTQEQPQELLDFLDFANITRSQENFFRRFPGMFWPEHCYGYGTVNRNYTPLFNETENDTIAPRRNYTAVGYIQANNQVERDVLTQLQLIFNRQQAVMPDQYHDYKFKRFNSLKEVENYVRDPGYTFDEDKPGLCFAFWIQKLSDTRFDISLMFNDQFDVDYAGAGIPKQTNAVWDPINSQANIKAFYKYQTGGYSIMQNLIANTILRSVTNQNASIAMVTVPQNQQPYKTDPIMEQILIQWLPLATLFAYLFPVFRITQRMVAEKETQVRDSMRMMGLNEIAYWASWLLYFGFINLIIAAICTLVLFSTLFTYSDPLLIYLIFAMYGLSLFGFITFVQSFFQNSRYSAVFASAFYLALYLVNLIVGSNDVQESGKNWASLIPQVALSLMIPHLGAFEAASIGLNFENIDTAYKNYTFSSGYKLLLLDFVIYTILGIYLDNVMPRESGMQKPLSFGFSYLRASYWDFFDLCQCKKRKTQHKYLYLRDAAKRKAELEDHDFLTFETKYMREDNFEAPDLSMKQMEKKRRFLKILDLQKQYSNGYKAVNGINLRMYEGQIFALLGHNGAGKTTTIKMLTGLLEPTEGEAFVYGYRVFSQGDMDTLRRYMGVCPQNNVLFDLLTPVETLRVFQNFKGASGTNKEKKTEIQKLLQDVGLWEDRKTLGKNLSGGMKRKLSVAIALCGQSKFVMLDEPTAGMDLQARHNLWNMLRAYRNDRIIVLTTHYMDEADVLGDRIGIMQNGNLVTVGSSLFLKKRYGVGYNFTLEKKALDEDEEFDRTKIDAYMKESLSIDIKLLQDVGDEIIYQVPTECSGKFKQFFSDFDTKLDELQIAGYGISVTSLEEVFLRVGAEDQRIPGPVNNDLMQSELMAQSLEEQMLENYSVAEQHTQWRLWLNLKAMCYKRQRLDRRRWRTILFSEFLIPVAFVFLGIWLTQLKFFFDSPARRIEPKMFPLPQRVLMNEEPILPSQGIKTNATGFKDTFSIPKLLDNFPSSYTLLNQDDFNVTYFNYTDEYQEILLQESEGLSFMESLYEGFNDDVYAMRNFGDTQPYRYGSYFVYQADPTTNQYKVINYVNTTSQDVAAVYPQFMYEGILRAATGQPNFQFRMTTRPFPISQRYRDQEVQTSVVSLICVVAIGLTMIPANVIGAILRERVKNLKHLQLISGLNLFAYHTINILFDIIKAEMVVAACCSIFLMWNLKIYYDSLVILLFWPLGVIPTTHAFAFLFSREWPAQIFVVLFNISVLAVCPIVVSSLLFVEDSLSTIEKVDAWLLFLPGYSLPRAMVQSGYQEPLSRFKTSIGRVTEIKNTWSAQNFGLNLLAIGAYCVLGTVVVFFMDNVFGLPSFTRVFNRIYENYICPLNMFSRKQGFQRIDNFEDDDVKTEEQRVEGLNKKLLQVKVQNLRKVYTKGCNRTLAVKNASFGTSFGECFVLLGVNGAGKTTTFRSLTNEIQPTSGKVSVGGYDVSRKFSKARKLIGFCPQENVLFDHLTVQEHLAFYAMLKGIQSKYRKKLVKHTIKTMDLYEQKKKLASALSGGNKRKLQVAIALIGNPPIILLDEPSAGMDPQARRFMWSVISSLNKKREKCAVILTTHSMEEAEALGTKVGIMVRGGQFRCFGSSQHIKNKYGTGFEVEVKIKPPTEQQLNNFRQLLQIQEFVTKMRLSDAITRMRERKYPEELIEEIRLTGLGDELVRESKFDSQGNIRVKHLVEWVHNMQYGTRVIRIFCKEFGTVSLLEQFSDYFKIRFSMQNKSIGYVFGLIEERKDYLGIAEYSVSQTTLEQIFQMFANSKRTDQDEEEQDKIRFDYTEPTETSKFEMVITRQNPAGQHRYRKFKGLLGFI